MNIVLVGMMGSGKSAVGRLLADQLGRPFIDTDAVVVAQAGRSIAEIFATDGEAAFRDLEQQVVAAVAAGDNQVIATGGGAVLAPENRAALRRSGVVCWLDAPPAELFARAAGQGLAERPLLAGPDPLAELTERVRSRAEAYALTSHHRVETQGLSVAAVAAEVKTLAVPRQLRVDLGERSYDILIGPGLLGRVGPLVRQTLPKVQRCLIITDSNVGPLYGETVRTTLAEAGFAVHMATVPAGEGSKTLAQVQQLYGACVGAGLDRTSAIVALGGGVSGDMAGFVAATYLRGIPFVQVPTTLLSQVDSSVGGKTGVDLPEGKNLVGAFHQPSLVVADPLTLTTLPRREVASGMGEVVKHAVIRDPAFLAFLEERAEAILALDPGLMAELVQRNCAIKAAVVSADEREGGLRAILNFGHTVGHAVEAVMGFGGWGHGECVALGMVAATAIAREAGVLQEPALAGRLVLVLRKLGLPVRLPGGLEVAALDPLMQRDKKVEGGRIKWVLPVRTGEVVVTPDVPPEAIRRALAEIGGNSPCGA
jgi:3-dehydroquinate synthase